MRLTMLMAASIVVLATHAAAAVFVADQYDRLGLSFVLASVLVVVASGVAGTWSGALAIRARYNRRVRSHPLPQALVGANWLQALAHAAALTLFPFYLPTGTGLLASTLIFVGILVSGACAAFVSGNAVVLYRRAHAY